MERIVAAMVDLIENDGTLRPTADQVATQADVSRRALYLHFDSLEEVFARALQRRTSEVLAGWQWPASATSAEVRIEWFTASWAAMLEALTPLCTAATQFEPSSTVVATALEEVRAWMRAATETIFRPELAKYGPDERLAIITALHFLTSYTAWTDLRRQGADAVRASDALRHLLRSLLV
jgi:AcrR family transcriptional regulator